MRNYDSRVFDAKDRATRMLIELQRANKDADVTPMASALDELNQAWDALTDALVRQRNELGERILILINEIAEEKKGK